MTNLKLTTELPQVKHGRNFNQTGKFRKSNALASKFFLMIKSFVMRGILFFFQTTSFSVLSFFFRTGE